jgi:hypothetical protein
MRVSMAAIIHRARWNFNVDEADGVSGRDTFRAALGRRREPRADHVVRLEDVEDRLALGPGRWSCGVPHGPTQSHASQRPVCRFACDALRRT